MQTLSTQVDFRCPNRDPRLGHHGREPRGSNLNLLERRNRDSSPYVPAPAFDQLREELKRSSQVGKSGRECYALLLAALENTRRCGARAHILEALQRAMLGIRLDDPDIGQVWDNIPLSIRPKDMAGFLQYAERFVAAVRSRANANDLKIELMLIERDLAEIVPGDEENVFRGAIRRLSTKI